MACKGTKHAKATAAATQATAATVQAEVKTTEVQAPVSRLLFGVDSKIQANDILQNNISEFEWVVRNKVYPNFWGRNLVGENALTKDELAFIHSKGCKIAAIYTDSGEKKTEEQGKIVVKKIDVVALELGIPKGTAVFLEVVNGEDISRDYMKGFAADLEEKGFVPGFKANTDAKFGFDREFSRGLQTDREIFKKCLVWAISPSLAEYDRVTTTHLIHPDNWMPYAPSGITRNDIAVWQYGVNCHPINDDAGIEITFNVNLVRDRKVIIDKMF